MYIIITGTGIYLYITKKQKTSFAVVALPYQQLQMGITSDNCIGELHWNAEQVRNV